MKLLSMLGSLAMIVMLSLPASAQGPVGRPEVERSEHMTGDRGEPGLGWSRGPQGGPGQHHAGMAWHGPMGGPLISLMLHNRSELGLSAAQVETLEKLRGDFMREAIRREADQKIAHLDLMGLMRPDPADPTKALDLAKVEGKIRDIEKMQADLRIARIRAIEAGKAQLTPEQRTKLAALLAQHRAHWHRRGPEPPAPPRG